MCPLFLKAFVSLLGLVGIVFLRTISIILSLAAEATEVLHLGKATIHTFNGRCAELKRDLETVRVASAWDAETYVEDSCCIAANLDSRHGRISTTDCFTRKS